MERTSALPFVLFILLLILCLSGTAIGQTGCNTGITLTTQAEVDAFSFTGVFDGSVQIGHPSTISDITNVNALSGLTGITNALTIRDNPVLTDISGLENLTFLGANNCQAQRLTLLSNPLLTDLSPLSGMTISPASRGVDIRSMPGLTSISALSGLTRCRSLTLSGLAVTSLDGLENLTDVTFINVTGNPQLVNIDALANVTTSWNPANENISVDLVDNPMLNDLSGLMGITLATSIEIFNCDALQDLSGMGGLLDLLGELDLKDNDGITSLAGLNSNLEIGTLLVLQDNSQLSDCAYEPICDQVSQGGQFGQTAISGNATGCATALEIEALCASECGDGITETLTSQEEVDAFLTTYGACRNFLGEIIIEEPANLGTSAAAITNLNALGNLRQINDLRILNAPGLTDLSGISALDSINNDLDIRNTAIVNLNELSSLKKIGGRLDIASNPVLESITSFSQIDLIPNFLVIRFNPELDDLSGFSNLVTIGDVLQIISNPSLPDLNDFSSLRFAFDGLEINDNDLLTSLGGLETLENINASLNITNNDLLSDISTLDNLDQATIVATSNGLPGSAALVITGNPLLNDCAIETVCTFLEGSGTAIDIQGNAVNCVSQSVVEANCLALPVTLNAFAATLSRKSVHLNWSTSSEQNTEKYTLERSSDGGRTFHDIGSVAAWNSNDGADYEYVDETAAATGASILYYRLRARDFDGATGVFGPRAVVLEEDVPDQLIVTPNPVNPARTVIIQGVAAGAEVRLMAIDGRLLATLSARGDGIYQLPDLPAGLYLVTAPNAVGKVCAARLAVD